MCVRRDSLQLSRASIDKELMRRASHDSRFPSLWKINSSDAWAQARAPAALKDYRKRFSKSLTSANTAASSSAVNRIFNTPLGVKLALPEETSAINLSGSIRAFSENFTASLSPSRSVNLMLRRCIIHSCLCDSARRPGFRATFRSLIARLQNQIGSRARTLDLDKQMSGKVFQQAQSSSPL